MSTLHLQPQNKSETTPSAREVSLPALPRAYSEVPGLRHETRDVLKQLNANILSLEDLSGRLSFVLSEVRGMIRR